MCNDGVHYIIGTGGILQFSGTDSNLHFSVSSGLYKPDSFSIWDRVVLKFQY